MKRVGGLFDAMADRQTLGMAAWRAARGKRQRPEVRQFLQNLDVEASRISRDLRAGEYQFGKYQSFSVRDPKTRIIHAPPFRDRVVHHAIIAVAGPVFEKGAVPESHACRLGHGQSKAMASARRWVRPGDWFLKGDVAKFYDSVDHDRLREALARRFRERRLLRLLDGLLDSYCTTQGHGLPIGALTSQYLGNFFLDPFDHWMLQKRRHHRYIRYMDDFVCMGPEASLKETRIEAHAVLSGLGLSLKHGAVLNRCDLGVPWLGFTVYPNRVRLNRAGRRRLRRRLKDIERGWERGRISDEDLQARSVALFAHAAHADDMAWRRMVCGFSRLGEAQGPQSRDARRLVGQLRQEVSLGHPQQEEAR